MECTQITKQDARATRWLQAGTIFSHLPSLSALNIEDNITVSADGFALRVAPTPTSLKEFSGKLVKLGKAPRVNGDLVRAETIDDSSFPDWRAVVPTSKPTYKIILSGEKLAELVKEMGACEFEFHSPTEPIVIKSIDKYAVLMPMHKFGHGSEESFDPINRPLLEEKES